MAVHLQALNCPNCAAPLQVEAGQSLTICLYCNSSIRLTYPSPNQAQPTADPTVQTDTIEQIKQLLLAGRQPEALLLYQQQTGATTEQAAQTIRNLSQQISAHIITGQQLSGVGVMLVVLGLLALLGGLITAATNTLPLIAAVAITMFGLFMLLLFGRALLTSLRFARAQRASAAVLRLAPIGHITTSGGPIHTFRLLLEVRPAGDSPFRAQINLPVRASNLTKLHENTLLQVKYLPGKPDSVVFDRLLSS